MNEYFQSSASRPRLPSIRLGSSFRFDNLRRMSATAASSSSFSINQNYNSIVGSMKSLFKDNVDGNDENIISKSQVILPKIDERRNSLTGNILKQALPLQTNILKQTIRKSKSENAVNSSKKLRNGGLKGNFPPMQESAINERMRNGSAPLRDINEHKFFGSTLPPRALLKKLPQPDKQQDERIEQLRQDIALTGDNIASNGSKSMKNKELSITTSKDGKRRVRRKKEKKKDGETEFSVSRRNKRKSISRRGSVSRRPSITGIPGSLGMTMWLHKFLYKSRRSSSMKIKEDEAKIKDVVDENFDVKNAANITIYEKPEITVNKTAESPIQKIDESKKLDIKSKMTSTLLADNQIHSWGFLRNQLVSAKVREAFSVIKFELKGRKLQVLRELGEGGYSKVFEVFDDNRDLYALKVVKIRCEDTEEDMDRNVKKNLKIVEEKDMMKEIRILELFQNCERVINMLDYEMRSDVSLPLSNILICKRNTFISITFKLMLSLFLRSY